MKTSIKIVAIAATALVAAGTTLAHPGGMGGGMGYGAGMGPGMGMGMGYGMGYGMGPAAAQAGDPAAWASARLATLKAELKITPAQEQAWAAFETVTQQQMAAMQTLRSQMHSQMQAQPQGNPADFAALRESMFKQHQANFAAREAAWTNLYAVLTPEQKAIADQRPHRGPGAGRGMGMGMGYGR
jgi:Spy/CpxP family protein refolding chaperone